VKLVALWVDLKDEKKADQKADQKVGVWAASMVDWWVAVKGDRWAASMV
jgi:hypothetical protein